MSTGSSKNLRNALNDIKNIKVEPGSESSGKVVVSRAQITEDYKQKAILELRATITSVHETVLSMSALTLYYRLA